MINIILLLHTGIRGDEKLLIKAAKFQKVKLEILDLRKLILNPSKPKAFENIDVVA